MARMMITRLTSKGQATIPVQVRKALRLRPGDRVAFDVSGNRATLRKLDPQDRAYLALAGEAFSEWNSPEDDEAFRDL
jgi:antitoxin PrlF